MPFEFKRLEIPGLIVVRPVVLEDARGSFKEIYKYSDFFALGIRKPFSQVNGSSSQKHVLRGLHYQKKPFAQAKLIRVVQGEIFDVAVDIRQGSPFFGKAASLILNAAEGEMLFVPEGFAHGFLTLSDQAEVEYLCSDVYSLEQERGVAFNDPALGINWPIKNPILSSKDRTYPALANIDNNFIYEK
jgi:dTDP-4-dehydrorhamnose 3,5-epimerase